MVASVRGIGGRSGRVRRGQQVSRSAVAGSGRAAGQQGGSGSRAGKHAHGTPSPSLPLILRPLPRILGYTADIAILL
jgi:hypothetical protein